MSGSTSRSGKGDEVVRPDGHGQGGRIGLLTDPDTPHRIAEALADSLPDEFEDGLAPSVEVELDAVTAGLRSTKEMLDHACSRKRERGWDRAICITDLPVRAEGRPVLAEVSQDDQCAVISLPTLGGLQTHRRARQVLLQVLDELRGPEAGDGATSTSSESHGLKSPLTRLLAPIRRQTVDDDESAADVRYYATMLRGRMRLLTGMVRTNRPWRLVFGLSRALAAAIAASAFGLSSSTIWQIGDQLGPGRQAVAVVGAVAALVCWLIAAHHLWERTGDGVDREQVVLYNTSTVVTLTIGVAVLYGLLFLVNVAIAAFLVPSSLLESTLGHPAQVTTYLSLAWSFTTMGALAGALGSSLETDDAVRQAAYGYRESRRRAEQVDQS